MSINQNGFQLRGFCSVNMQVTVYSTSTCPYCKMLKDYLSEKARDCKEDTIMFCGVRFMAESAKILSPQKKVLMPCPSAGCAMADMASSKAVVEMKENNRKKKKKKSYVLRFGERDRDGFGAFLRAEQSRRSRRSGCCGCSGDGDGRRSC